MKLKLSFLVFFSACVLWSMAKKPISGKDEKAFAKELIKFFQGFDRPSEKLVDQYTNYDEYVEMLIQAVPDPENKIRQKVAKSNAEDLMGYTVRRLEGIKAGMQNAGLEWKNANSGRIEEEKQYENGFLRRVYIHFKVGSRKAKMRIDYCYFESQFYLLGLKRFSLTYQKQYEEPIAFTSALWDKLPREFPNDRRFYYPEMKTFETDASSTNSTVTIENSPELDSLLNAHKSVGDSRLMEMVDLEKDSMITGNVEINSNGTTLYHSTFTYTLRQYEMDKAQVWIPIHLEFKELKSDSVVYKVSSNPKASLQTGYLFFTCKMDLRFGQYSNERRAHNGAQVGTSINTYMLCKANELIVEMTCEDMNEEFPKRILKGIFQDEGNLQFRLTDHKNKLVTSEYPSEKMPVKFHTSEPIEIKMDRD